MPATSTQNAATQAALSRRAHWAGGEPITSLLMARTLAQPELISLAAGFVDYDTLPVEPVRKALDAILPDPARARAALQYGTTIGHAPLRQAILDRLLAADAASPDAAPPSGPNPSIDQLVLTAGSNQLLYTVGDVLLDPGDIVLTGAPTYFVLLGILANQGARAVGATTDDDGLVPEAVEEQLRRLDAAGELDRVKAIYVTTYYDNPTGATVPAGRRAALVDLARRYSRKHKIYVIEDSAYRELRYDAEDVPSLRSFDPAGELVVHAGTFSKSFAPGIRVGWGLLPPELLRPVLAAKGHWDFGSPNFNQHLMATVIELGIFDEHLEELRAGYRRKMDAMLDAADRFLAPLDGVEWARPRGGLYVWLRLPEQIDTGLNGPLFDLAVRQGVLYVPGEHCFPPGTPGPTRNTIRLSFGIQSCETIRTAMEILAAAIGRVLE